MAAAAPLKDQVGIATTTPIAFVHDGALYLERMSVLSLAGAGVLAETLPSVGMKLEVAFRLSTAAHTCRVSAEVVGHLPTTPQGMALAQKAPDRVLRDVIGKNIGDSATVIFRMGDVERAHAQQSPQPRANAGATPSAAPVGFCLRFVAMNPETRKAVSHHIEVSVGLSEQLAVRNGRAEPLVRDEKATLTAMFDDGDLSRKASDW